MDVIPSLGLEQNHILESFTTQLNELVRDCAVKFTVDGRVVDVVAGIAPTNRALTFSIRFFLRDQAQDCLIEEVLVKPDKQRVLYADLVDLDDGSLSASFFEELAAAAARTLCGVLTQPALANLH